VSELITKVAPPVPARENGNEFTNDLHALKSAPPPKQPLAHARAYISTDFFPAEAKRALRFGCMMRIGEADLYITAP
jgi:hypothetical protein